MSKKVITHTIETVVEDWEMCNFRAATGDVAKTNRCGYCRFQNRRYYCAMFDTFLQNKKESVNIVFKCDYCLEKTNAGK